MDKQGTSNNRAAEVKGRARGRRASEDCCKRLCYSWYDNNDNATIISDCKEEKLGTGRGKQQRYMQKIFVTELRF